MSVSYNDGNNRGKILYTAANDVAVVLDERTAELAVVDRWGECLGWYGGVSAIDKAKRAADLGSIIP